MTDDDVLPYVRDRLPEFVPAGPPERLPEGNLNMVWRLPGEEQSVIVKHAPPYIAATPDVPLDPTRLLIEAQCLSALGPEGPLSVEVAGVRTPRVRDVNEDAHVLVMEDVGACPTLGRWLHAREEDEPTLASTFGRRLGRFIGRLHAATHKRSSYADAFDNRPMQDTRHAVQYQGVTEMLGTGGVADADELGRTAEALGTSLLETGACLTMGDLWPPSVLVDDETLFLIDWELAHYGRPLQDVAHLCAHLWMQCHRAPSPAAAAAVDSLHTQFLDGYVAALGEAQETLWTESEHRDAAVHFGAELLVRAVGPFQDGYLYEGLVPDSSVVQEVVRTAARHLRAPETVDMLSA